jgi:hypothetical protein
MLILGIRSILTIFKSFSLFVFSFVVEKEGYLGSKVTL